MDHRHATGITMLLFVMLCITGCDSGGEAGALIGKWKLDRPYTEQRLEPQGSARSDNPAPSLPQAASVMMGGMKNAVVRMLLDKMENITIQITADEIIAMEGRAGKAQPYEIVEKPAPNQWTIRGEDGEVQTLAIEDGYLVMPMTGDVSGNLYLKRVEE